MYYMFWLIQCRMLLNNFLKKSELDHVDISNYWGTPGRNFSWSSVSQASEVGSDSYTDTVNLFSWTCPVYHVVEVMDHN